jgi:hypothetical protein
VAQVEFRTGFREVPDHLAAMMRNMETWRMTYEEAVDKANWKVAADYANKVQDSIVRQSLGKR